MRGIGRGPWCTRLLAHCGADLSGIGGARRPGIVHRLDRGTSGLLVVAKNDGAHAALARQLKARTVERRYLALVHGRLPHAAGVVETAIGRDPRDRLRMAVRPAGAGRPALTRYRVLERFARPAPLTLLEATLGTGRTHQIRVHLAHLGAPVVGDRTYRRRGAMPPDPDFVAQVATLGGQALHAAVLGFTHPTTGAWHRFEAPPPPAFAALLGWLRRSSGTAGRRPACAKLERMATRGRHDGGRRVVAIGGGTGLPVILTALKRYLGGRVAALTAIVTVTDDGGSSGRLRDELQVLPPGDIRNCLVALAEVEPLMAELFQFRFPGESQLAGHSFGNLFLAALTQVTGNFLHAIRISGKVLAVRGTILPSTLDVVRLGAELADGRRVLGESSIARQGIPIRRVFLEPAGARALPEVFEAIAHAHVVVLAPGSLYTSLIPNLLVGGVADALRAAPALKIGVANLMTEPGETDGMSLADHLAALQAHGARGVIDGIVAHGRPFPPDVLERYAQAGASPVAIDRERVRALGVWLTEADVASPTELARHHPEKLGRVLARLIRHGGPARRREAVRA